MSGDRVVNVLIAGLGGQGVVKAKDRAAMVDEMISAVRRAWDERIAQVQ